MSSMLQALVLEDSIRRQMDSIIQGAAETVRLLKPKSKSKMQKNQIRNVLNVAEESRSVEVVTNYIRYQIGRSPKGQQWRYKGFGIQVINDIEKGVVEKAANQACADTTVELGEGVDQASLFREIYPRITSYYLGYLNRAFYFCTEMEGVKMEGFDDFDPWDEVVRGKEGCQDV